MTDPVFSLATTGISAGTLSGYAQVTDYTTSDIANYYQTAVLGIDQVLHGTPTTAVPIPPAPVLTTASANQLSAYVTVLRNLYKYGQTLPVDPSDPNGILKTYFLTYDMAQQLGPLFQSLQSLGVVIPNNPNTPVVLTLQQAKDLQDLSSTSLILNALFAFAANSGSNKTIQSLVELEYVKAGNDVMADTLTTLQDALDTTKTTLDQLANLQLLHNQIVINDKSAFGNKFNFNGTYGNLSPSAYASAYGKAASAYFGVPIAPSITSFPANSAYQLANVPAGTALIGPSSFTTLNPLAADFAAIRNNIVGDYDNGATPLSGMLYAIKNVSTGLYDVYHMTGAYPGVSNLGWSQVNINGLNLTDTFTIIPSVPLSSTFTANYGSFSTAPSISFTKDSTDSAGNPVTLTLFAGNTVKYCEVPGSNSTSASRELRIFEDYKAINTIFPNIFSVSTSYKGVNVSNSAINDAVQYLKTDDVFATPNPTLANIVSFHTPSKFGTEWLGFINGSFVVDSRDPAAFTNLQKQLVLAMTMLSAQIPNLSATTPRINITQTNPNGDEDPNSLLARTKSVLNDLKTTLVAGGGGIINNNTSIQNAYNGIRNWLIDNYGTRTDANSTKAGALQQNITFAITSGQSLNDTQKEKVRQFLYIFEEYYKSASAILQQITQILERMAQGIAR
ncbi:MAG: hypothetical protein H0X51_03165 [Parachlamydiaceae bacterium]|nr:hypothetical protein [Parachlamydiaceae bacterium]